MTVTFLPPLETYTVFVSEAMPLGDLELNISSLQILTGTVVPCPDESVSVRRLRRACLSAILWH